MLIYASQLTVLTLHVHAPDKMATSQMPVAILSELIGYEKRWIEADDQVNILDIKIADLQVRYDRAVLAHQKSHSRSLSIQMCKYVEVQHMYSLYSDHMLEKIYAIRDRFEEDLA